MGRMVRKQVYLDPEQEAFLKRRSEQLGVTESDLIRQAIVDAMQRTVQAPRDISDWDEAIAFARERAKLPIAGTGGERGWTREELYDRLDRFSR